MSATHNKSSTSEYYIYHSIKARCYNPNATRYECYGGRGVKMCERWLESFENFYEDMGDRPSKSHSIDRIDSNGHYSPDNCKWETVDKQNRNQTLSTRNKTGVVGVHYCESHHTYVGTWRSLEGKVKRKEFSINKYGEKGAFNKALKARKEAVKDLNSQGAGYSECHGKVREVLK